MSVSLNITVDDSDAREILDLITEEVGDLKNVNARIAVEAEEFFRTYLTAVAKGRHKTANRLGAQPSGFFERAAQSPEGTSNSKGATISLSPGAAFARAFRPITIRPKGGKKWLAIPATKTAYARRPGEFGNTLSFLPLGKELAALVGRAKVNGKRVVFYWLKKKIEQKQERELLPSDEAISAKTLEVVDEYFDDLLEDGGVA